MVASQRRMHVLLGYIEPLGFIPMDGRGLIGDGEARTAVWQCVSTEAVRALLRASRSGICQG